MRTFFLIYSLHYPECAPEIGLQVIYRADNFYIAETDEKNQSRLQRSVPEIIDVTDNFGLVLSDAETLALRLRLREKIGSPEAVDEYGLECSSEKLRFSAYRELCVIQFCGPVRREWLDELSACGFEPLTYYRGFSIVCRRADPTLDVPRQPFIFHSSILLLLDAKGGWRVELTDR